MFRSDAPVFLTAFDRVKCVRRGREVLEETDQMNKRISYLALTYEIPEGEREEVTRPCGHCGARLYLEGKAPGPLEPRPLALPAEVPASGEEVSAAGDQAVGERQPKRRRAAAERVQELLSLKARER